MKVVVITGISSGIGLVVGKGLRDKGFKVYGLSRTKINEENIISLEADITKQEEALKQINYIIEKENKIDILINNAGMGISGSIEDTEVDDIKTIFDVNFLGMFNTTKAVIPYMRAQNYGKIINISSVAAVLSIPFQAFYSSTKAAVNAFSEALKNEISPFNIGVSVILPGDIKSGFTKNRRKNKTNNKAYKDRVEKSISLMEKDEQNGMDPKIMTKTILKLIKRKRMPLYVTVGFKYKIFVILQKILPKRLVNHIVGGIYGFKNVY